MTKMDTYVYYHIDPDSKEIFYIGVGQYDRAWCIRTNQRSKEHVQKLKNLYSKGYTLENVVKIYINNLTKEQALITERKLIDEHRPVFNKNKNKNHWDVQRKFNKQFCEELKALHEMGYGYNRIAFLSGSSFPKINAMSIKRMIGYV